MGVYLQGARDATKQYVDLTRRTDNAEAKASYMTLLDDLEANFTAKTQKLLSNNKDALSIEIDVLLAAADLRLLWQRKTLLKLSTSL